MKDTPYPAKEAAAIIFEDDIGVEWDLQARLEDMWADLPSDWDIIFEVAPPLYLHNTTNISTRTQVTTGPTNRTSLSYHLPPPCTLQTTRNAHAPTPSHRTAPDGCERTSRYRPSRSRARWARRSRGWSVMGR